MNKNFGFKQTFLTFSYNEIQVRLISILKFVMNRIADFFTNCLTVRLPGGHSFQKSCRRGNLISRGPPLPRDWERHPDTWTVNSCRRGHARGELNVWLGRTCETQNCKMWTQKWIQLRFRLLEHHLRQPMRIESLTYHLDVANGCNAPHKEVNLNFSCTI
jgi:hypothetical protein